MQYYFHILRKHSHNTGDLELLYKFGGWILQFYKKILLGSDNTWAVSVTVSHHFVVLEDSRGGSDKVVINYRPLSLLQAVSKRNVTLMSRGRIKHTFVCWRWNMYLCETVIIRTPYLTTGAFKVQYIWLMLRY